MSHPHHAADGGVPAVSPQEASTLQADGGALIVDVREPYEHEEARVDGAVLVPLGQLPGRVADLPRDRTLLLLCHSGMRSARATAFLAAQGFELAANITGGMVAWHNAGLPVRTGPLDPGEGEL